MLQNNQLDKKLPKKNTRVSWKIQTVFSFIETTSNRSNHCTHWICGRFHLFSVIAMWLFKALRVTALRLISEPLDNCTAAMKMLAAKLSSLLWSQRKNYTRSGGSPNSLKIRKRATKMEKKTLYSFSMQHKSNFRFIAISSNPINCWYKLIFIESNHFTSGKV